MIDDRFLTDILRITVTLTFLGFFLYILFREFSFSFGSPSRRYQYMKKHDTDEEFEIVGSGFFKNRTIQIVSMIPRYPGEPHRRVCDSKRDVVIYDSKEM